MHAWMWGEQYVDFMDGLVPLACVPAQIAGRNRIMRQFIASAIRSDPAWMNGEYTSPPVWGLRAATGMLFMMQSAPLQQLKQYPTRDAAEKFADDYIARQIRSIDANDFLFQFEASRDYDPSEKLELIKAPVLAINSADDLVNPPELGLMEKLMPRVRNGRYILIPTSDATRGHGTHTMPSIWGSYLAEFLKPIEQAAAAR
jgi:homoserine O-acetyltransferase